MKIKEKNGKNYVIIGEFLRRTKGKRVAAALGLAVTLGMTGGAGKEASEKLQENASAGDNMTGQENADGGAEDAQEGENDPDVLATQEGEWVREEPVSAQENEPEEPVENSTAAQENKGQSARASEGNEHLGGKVQEPTAGGMTLIQTTLVDEDGMVTLLDMKDAKKIPVKFTQDTKVEHWTIQGGGAGIDMRDAAVSDLEEGMGVELEGYFEGESFVATRVIMEEDV